MEISHTGSAPESGARPSLPHGAMVFTSPKSGARPKTLAAARSFFAELEAKNLADAVVPLADITYTPDDTLEIPGQGTLLPTVWAKSQLARLVGLKFDRWFENAGGAIRADDMNRRFRRSTETVKLRSRRIVVDVDAEDADEGAAHADGVLRALVSPTYTAVSDERIADELAWALAGREEAARLVRFDVTDMTASYVVSLGDAYRKGEANAHVGELWGGLHVRNSDVGFACLSMTLHLTRLLCLNGMVAPIPDAFLFRKAHRRLDEDALTKHLELDLDSIGERLHRGARTLARSAERRVLEPETEFRKLLRDARLPKKLLPALLNAYQQEPDASAFGLSQALTLAAQNMTPETRYELERLAGRYLTQPN